jgi:RHS repeat-associated protein
MPVKQCTYYNYKRHTLLIDEEYYPYGDTSYRAGRNIAEVGLKRYRYTGKEKDEESGLYYYGARYYSPMTGIFISVDPKFEKYLEVSSYIYCLNNPMKYVDITGENPGHIRVIIQKREGNDYPKTKIVK